MDAEGVGRRLDPPYPDEAAIERIVRIPDLLERNAAITRGYHALSEAVAAILGRDQANWLTFGQWASAEARRSISAEAIPAPLRGLMSEGVAAAVAEGNAAIFRDVAPPFIRFVRAFAPIAGAPADPGVDAAVDPAAIRTAGEGLCAHPTILASPDLTRAFTAYTDAILFDRGPDRTTPDAARRRAQRILVANASIGAHEQVIAEPFVRAAIPGRWIVAIAATSHMGLRISPRASWSWTGTSRRRPTSAGRPSPRHS